MSETKPVLVVGAGPTGMTAAMELARFGVPVRLIDKLPEPSTTSRALAIQARTLELLVPRGPGREILCLGHPARTATLHGKDKVLGRVELSRIPSRYNYILLLSQAETERLLREQLERQDVVIERGTEMIAFSQGEGGGRDEGGGIKAMLRHPNGSLEEVEASYLICAEGAHSSVRRTLDLPFEGNTLEENYALADLYIDGNLPNDELSIFLTDEGLLAIFPLGGRHFRFIATEPEKYGRADQKPGLAELQALYDAGSYLPARLRDVTWSSRFWINSRMLRHLRERRVFFGGDAAHVHSPAGGQGMNTGIQDMIDLGWKLALVWHGQAAPELLDTYEEERLPVIRDIVKRTETATVAANSKNRFVHGLLTHLAPVLLKSDRVQQAGTRVISEVAANYRLSALSRGDGKAGGSLHAGDRIPDVTLSLRRLAEAGDGQAEETAVYDLLDPTRLTLLVTGGSLGKEWPGALEQTLKPWQELVEVQAIAPPADEEGHERFEDLFGPGQSLLMVRPDAYQGFGGKWNDVPKLLDWLRRWFPPTA